MLTIFRGSLLVVIGVAAALSEVEAQYAYTTNNNTITITAYFGTGGDVTIPSTINGLTVANIGNWAFAFSGLTTVMIPNSVTGIGFDAFHGCTNLTSVTIPISVITIGNNTFADCTSLTSVTIPASIPSIVDSMFVNCTRLTSITIPDGVTSIGQGAFWQCTSLSSVTIPNSVTSIGVQAFQYCTHLTTVTIPNSVSSIGNDAFACCSNLTSVTLPVSITSIGDSMFANCTSLISITIPSSVTGIGAGAFWKCTNFRGVFFLGDVPSVGANAFTGDPAIVYYLACTTGWGATFGGLPTTLWIPPPPGGLIAAALTNATADVRGVYIALVGAANDFIASRIDTNGSPVSCLWDFGDGSTSTDCNPSHVYTNCKSFTVTYTAANSCGTSTTNLTVSVPCAMLVANVPGYPVCRLNFAAPYADSAWVKAFPQPDQCTNWLGKAVTLDVGGAQVSWTLNPKGRGVNTNGMCKFTYNKRTGVCKFTAHLIHGSWQSAWAGHGLVDATIPKPGVAVTLPVILVIGDEAFMAEKPLHYTAKAGKSGTAK